MFLLYYLGYFLKTFMFDVDVGNADWAELHDPAHFMLENTINLYMDGYEDPAQKIGAWFIKPKSALDLECKRSEPGCVLDPLLQTPPLTEKDTVFVLLHGNGRNRGAAHRLAAYKIFQELGFYTLTIDYRGYGDSSKLASFGDLSEASVVEDAANALRQLRKRLGDKFQLLIYGHSMGTPTSTHAATIMQDEGIRVDGVILDSGFHSMRNVLKKTEGWMSTFLQSIFDCLWIMNEVGLGFDCSKYLNVLKCPVRLFHAEVDHVLPISESEDMLRDAKESGKRNVDFIRFTEEGLGHIGISTTKGFKDQIDDFAQLCRENKLKK